MDLYFTDNDDFYPCLSNLFPSPIKIGDITYPSAENFYQSERILSPEPTKDELFYSEKIIQSSPEEARVLGSVIEVDYVEEREDWKDLREDAMLEILRAKFVQNKNCREVLMETGGKRLHLKTGSVKEDEFETFYWGTGNASLGKDKLGALLMIIRQELFDNQILFKSKETHLSLEDAYE